MNLHEVYFEIFTRASNASSFNYTRLHELVKKMFFFTFQCALDESVVFLKVVFIEYFIFNSSKMGSRFKAVSRLFNLISPCGLHLVTRLVFYGKLGSRHHFIRRRFPCFLLLKADRCS